MALKYISVPPLLLSSTQWCMYNVKICDAFFYVLRWTADYTSTSIHTPFGPAELGSEGEKCYRRFTNTPIVNIALFSQSSRFLRQKHP